MAATRRVQAEPDQLAQSWDANAAAWTRLVRAGGIESRRVATDAAILDAILSTGPVRVVDVGCGEGWLCHTLHARGWRVVGVDGSSALVEAARKGGGGEFHHLSYEELAAHPEKLGLRSHDLVACNFSLLHEDLEPLLRACGALLAPGGRLVIQTVHPWTARGDAAYADAWRLERFEAFGDEFREPMPWYYRTFGSWVDVLGNAGFLIEWIREPMHPETGQPLSLLLSARCSEDSTRIATRA